MANFVIAECGTKFQTKVPLLLETSEFSETLTYILTNPGQN